MQAFAMNDDRKDTKQMFFLVTHTHIHIHIYIYIYIHMDGTKRLTLLRIRALGKNSNHSDYYFDDCTV